MILDLWDPRLLFVLLVQRSLLDGPRYHLHPCCCTIWGTGKCLPGIARLKVVYDYLAAPYPMSFKTEGEGHGINHVYYNYMLPIQWKQSLLLQRQRPELLRPLRYLCLTMHYNWGILAIFTPIFTWFSIEVAGCDVAVASRICFVLTRTGHMSCVSWRLQHQSTCPLFASARVMCPWRRCYFVLANQCMLFSGYSGPNIPTIWRCCKTSSRHYSAAFVFRLLSALSAVSVSEHSDQAARTSVMC